MFKDLTSNIKSLLSDSTTLSNQIENELESLHEKRATRVEEMNELQSTLPDLKRYYYSLVRAFGYSENNLKKEDAIKAKKAVQDAVNNYKKLEESLEEIERSISALETSLDEDLK